MRLEGRNGVRGEISYKECKGVPGRRVSRVGGTDFSLFLLPFNCAYIVFGYLPLYEVLRIIVRLVL